MAFLYLSIVTVMEKSLSLSQKVYLSMLVFIAWFTLIFQFYLHINSGAATKSELLIRFFSYFTIDSNLLVALCSTSILFFRSTLIASFFAKLHVISAIAVYIIVVALVYNVVLRFLWVLEGWSMVLNELLHVVVPIMFLIYWIYFVPKQQLQWKNIWLWLVFPLLYTVFVLVRGNFSGFYPYPFLNINELGLNKVLINCLVITLLFALLSALFVAIGKRKAKVNEGKLI
ncbi:Pr6Pr family membrane protein [Pedobacter sp. SL55]|uniref:Pr6Pr family membrane protein n=1 Tax=Pedobacter sp. SL55 TaxID=2995161 RepID=UPI00226E2A11|nr:Pr6Pr family membrane protein [Pedobacter sp. SL55]WAC40971.1 Pr6Pr family membrane protein [Pedobacter sp. SL55]